MSSALVLPIASLLALVCSAFRQEDVVLDVIDVLERYLDADDATVTSVIQVNDIVKQAISEEVG